MGNILSERIFWIWISYSDSGSSITFIRISWELPKQPRKKSRFFNMYEGGSHILHTTVNFSYRVLKIFFVFWITFERNDIFQFCLQIRDPHRGLYKWTMKIISETIFPTKYLLFMGKNVKKFLYKIIIFWITF